MAVYFNSNALSNEYTKEAVGKMQTSMDEIQKQIDTAKQYEHFYDLSFSETKNLLHQAQVIEEDHQNVAILKEGLHKTNEMSAQLDQLLRVLQDGLVSWQKLDGTIKNENNKNLETTRKSFAKDMLSNFEVILNKRSEYDGTYLFSDEDVDTKPIDLSESSDATNYYKGSKRNVLFTYNEQEIELNFNAGNESIKNLVTLLKGIRDGTQNTDEVFDKLKEGTDKVIVSKKEVDAKSKSIKVYLDHEEISLATNVDMYDVKTRTDNVLTLTDLTRIASDLQAIYTSNKILLSTKLVDYL